MSSNPRLKNIFFWGAIGVFAIWLFNILGNAAQPAVEQTPYSDITRAAKENRLNQIKVTGKEMTGKYKGADGREIAFKSQLPEEGDSSALKEIRDSGVTISAEPAPGTPLYMTLLLFLGGPLILLGGMAWLQGRMMGGKGGAGSFTKPKAKIVDQTKEKKVTFQDVAGVDEARAEVQEIVDFLRDPKKFTALGGRMPKGTMLVGPPGTGKTLLAKAVAGEAGVPFFSAAGSDFVEMFVGVGASRVRNLFEEVKKHAPCILFIDEIDALGRNRGATGGGASDERDNTLNQFLVEVDGFDGSDGVILMAATNRPEMLDPAVTRAGRFDRQVSVNNPNMKGREDILGVHVRRRNVPLAAGTDLRTVARGTPGFSGADIENLVNEAALIAARKMKSAVDTKDFEDARDKILMGPERKSMMMSQEEKERTAWHEAGHTLVGLMVPRNEPLHKVSIVPRGRALGVTATLPTEDRYNMTENELKARLAMMYGGRFAEEIIYKKGNISTGAHNDIERATQMAWKMVTEWGYSELGAVNFAGDPQKPFFDAANDLSPGLKRQIEKEHQRILAEAQACAMNVLQENHGKLAQITAALMEYETIDAADIDNIMNDRPVLRDLPPSASTGPAPEPAP